MSSVVVIDYGVGNLFSVRRALEYCGAEVTLTSDPRAILSASRLVLPGVGAFADGMRGLAEHGLISAIQAYANSGRPFLGICLGMQMLATASEEFGEHAGLGIVPGRVTAIPRTGIDGTPHKIPHIGWTELAQPERAADWGNTILADLEPGASVYLVHSYAVTPENDSHRLADCFYNGRRISAAIRKGNVYGCQFHPEKSGEAGLRILDRFCRLDPAGQV